MSEQIAAQPVEYKLRSVPRSEGVPEPVFLSFQGLDPRRHILRGVLIGAGIGLGLGIGAGVIIGGFLGGVIGGIITALITGASPNRA